MTPLLVCPVLSDATAKTTSLATVVTPVVGVMSPSPALAVSVAV